MAPRLALFLFAGLLFASPFLVLADFDYYTFVLLWPGAYCAQSKCCLPKTGLPADDFLIQGLYTYNATNGNSVTKCTQSNFYINDLAGLKDGLYSYYANIRCPSNDGKSSWRSAWKTYGVCTNVSEVDYFKTALELNAMIDLLSALGKHGIRPDYNLYSVESIKLAIAEEIGVKPAVRCSKGPFNKFQLYQVYVCVDKDGSTLINCPVYPKFTCSDVILFHPYKSWMLNASSTAASAAAIELPLSMD